MKTVLIECTHLGREFRCARKSAGIPLRDAARMLGVDRKTLLKYERGTSPISDSIVQRLAHFGYVLLRARDMTRCDKK